MVWLAIVLGWFVLTVLRDERRRFAFGALASAFVVIASLDVANPDALIVRTNTYYRHLEGDAGYDERPLASLSADATPSHRGCPATFESTGEAQGRQPAGAPLRCTG